MMICLTEKCSMGCTHCMSDCKPDGIDMTPKVLIDVLEFVKKNRIQVITFSGGELFENEYIKEILDIIADYFAPNYPVSFGSNGRILSSNLDIYNSFIEFTKKFKKGNVLLQITDDERFYPTKLDEKQRYRLNKIGAIIEGVPGNGKRCLYPQGRALENFNEEWWNTKAPNCTNVRLIANQKSNISFGGLCNTLFKYGFICTPTITPRGYIKLGESNLCPPVANIYQSDKEIIENILNCKCSQCKVSLDILKDNNPLVYSMFMGRDY